MLEDDPFRILIIGDFSGRASRQVQTSVAGRRPVLVDRDNLDEAMRLLSPELDLDGMRIPFRELDDFHPDNLYAALPLLRSLGEEKTRPIPAPPPKAAPLAVDNLLDQMLEEASPQESRTPDPLEDLPGFLRKVTAPYLEQRPDPRLRAIAEQADATASTAMRAILHHPGFQALEAAWRALDLLTRRLETGENLKLYILDVTSAELAAEPESINRLFAGNWAVIAANYSFGDTAVDIDLLRKLGHAAQAGRAVLFAEALPPPGKPSEEWSQLRRSPEAKSIGLALPRFLLRLPYGAGTSPVESFPFEEMPESSHEAYLWGNPAFACALLVGLAFSAEGWSMRAGSVRRIEGLPLHSWQQDGEWNLKPCAEVLMKETDAEYLLRLGIMPLASLKEQDTILLVRFQSIADPPAALDGRWG